MDVATRTIDLSRAILDIINKESSVRNAAGEILEWLGRERIEKQEYQYCVEALRAQAFPNSRGLEIQHQVRQSEEKVLSVAGLKLKLSTSIGRWMLNDPNFVYVVTTVAICMMFHDMAYAVEVLCNFALDQGGHEKGVSYRRSHYRLRLKPVVAKFVDSIALNIVNVGHDFRSALPDALKNVCSHPLEAPQLSAIIKAVSTAQNDMIITSNLFPGDLAMWLLTHFHGTLEISLNGTVVFEEQSGTDPIRVIFVINNTCSTCPDRVADIKQSNIKVATILDGKITTLMDESHCFHQQAEPCTRQKLYDTGLLTDYRRGQLSRNEVAEIRLAAQSILRWLLGLRIRISDTAPVFVLSQLGGCEANDPDIATTSYKTNTLENMLAGYPTILNKNWGQARGSESQAIYEPPNDHGESDSEEEMQRVVSMSISDIVGCFPMAVSVTELVQQRCTCRACTSGTALGSGSLGCLRESALDELILLITHGISNAFGASDVSGLCNLHAIRNAFIDVFQDIILQSTLQWDRWFRLVALVHLGGDLNEVPPWAYRSENDQSTSSLAVYQRGSLVIAASWLDLTSDLATCRVFGAHFGRGQIRGINSEEAEVELEPGLSLDAPGDFKLHTPSQQDLSEGDDGMCLVESALVSTGERSYRLLTMLRSASYRRLIDPFNAVLGLFRSRYPKCSHSPSIRIPVLQYEKELHLATFDHVVGTFSVDPMSLENAPEWRPNTIRVTRLLDTYIKYNVVLTLIPDGGVVSESCCLVCACHETERAEVPPYIIRRGLHGSGALVKRLTLSS